MTWHTGHTDESIKVLAYTYTVSNQSPTHTLHILHLYSDMHTTGPLEQSVATSGQETEVVRIRLDFRRAARTP